jgi:hypothetical protein
MILENLSKKREGHLHIEESIPLCLPVQFLPLGHTDDFTIHTELNKSFSLKINVKA